MGWTPLTLVLSPSGPRGTGMSHPTITPKKGFGMLRVQYDVRELHRRLDIPIRSTIAIMRPKLRVALIREESNELCDALLRGDVVEAIDGMCDLIVVTLGTAVEMGVDLEPFWYEVHRSNMAKAGGPVRGDGKQLKPDGWTPPDIHAILMNRYYRF